MRSSADGPARRVVFHEIASLGDPLLLPWLDLYETAFPPDEKVPVSDHLRALREPPDPDERKHLLAALDGEGNLVAMARCDVYPRTGTAYLIYLAVQEAVRGSGIGRAFYREICRRVADEEKDVQAVVYEVERPDHAHGPEGRKAAERRIRFYQRLGAGVMQGIAYVQQVPNHDPVPMFLMVHPLREPLAPQAAYDLLASLFVISRTGEPLSFVPHTGTPLPEKPTTAAHTPEAITLRRLKRGDIELAAKIASRAFTSESIYEEIVHDLTLYCDDGLEELQIRAQRHCLPREYYLVLDGSRVVGLTGLYRFGWAWEGEAWLGWTAIDAGEQSRGLGSGMLRAVAVEARKKGFSVLHVETLRGGRATGFYQRNGFRETGIIPHHYGPAADATVLTRALDDAAGESPVGD